MARWRDIKQNNIQEHSSKESSSQEETLADIPSRIKAFIVDMFMIMMPIMYISTYLILDGKEDFQGSSEARWITSAVFGIIIITFWILKGQTPGFKAYNIKLVDNKTHHNISLLKAFIRYLVFIFSAVTIILAFVPFFRKDKKTIQDVIAGTCVIPEPKV
jgi:uncharacterized RDD family membrane protein YckC